MDRKSLLRSIVKRYSDLLLSYVRFRGVPERDAGDVLQQVFCKADQLWDRYNGAPGEELPWLRGIARNEVSDHLKRACQLHEQLWDNEPPDSCDVAPTPEATAIEKERFKLLGHLLHTVTQERRRLLIAHHLEGKTSEELAAEEGIPVGTVKSRLSRGWGDLLAARDQWQDKQRRKGFDVLPTVLPPYWNRDLLRSLRSSALKLTAATRVAMMAGLTVVACLMPPSVQTSMLPTSHHVSNTPMMALDVVPSTQVPTAIPEIASTSQPVRRPDPVRVAFGAERKLFDRASLAIAKGDYAAARDLLNQHAQQFPYGEHATERDALLQYLSAQGY